MPRNVETEVPKKRISTNGYRLPEPISEGEVFTDVNKRQWKLGRSIGVGGFGEIYLASDDISKPVDENARYIIKIEHHSNGPLFVEMNFYLRAAKLENIDRWVAKRNLNCLGIPYFVGTGSHTYKGERYRFIVIPKYGQDLEKVLHEHNRKLHIKTAFTLASYIIDVLEYVHNFGYVHADIKPSNLLLGTIAQAPVYLVDFGIACRYRWSNGRHKDYCVDERRAHYGTIEYTSRDAHIGAISRRGDLEILGYNLVYWLTGRLPWEDDLLEPEIVAEKKKYCMDNLPEFLESCFAPDVPPKSLEKFLVYVNKLKFSCTPNYNYCKSLFKKAIKEAGFIDDSVISFKMFPKFKSGKKRNIISESENRKPEYCSPFKKLKLALQENDGQSVEKENNNNRMTRNALSALSNNNSLWENFNWAKILAGNPESMCKKDKEKPVRNHPLNVNNDVDYSPRMACFHDVRDNTMDNPTPIMKKILKRMQQRAKEAAISSNKDSLKRTKSESSRCNSPTECYNNNNSNNFTPAMEEVIRRRGCITRRSASPPNARSTRSSSRRERSKNATNFKKETSASKLLVPRVILSRSCRHTNSSKG